MKKKVGYICAVCSLLAICASASASVTNTLQNATQPALGWYGAASVWSDSGLTVYIVPEPATLSLLVIGGAGVLLIARRRHRYP